MAPQARNRIPRVLSPAQIPGPTQDEDEIFGSVEGDEVYIDPIVDNTFASLDFVGPIYPDVRRRNPHIVARQESTSHLGTYQILLKILAFGIFSTILAVIILRPAVQREKARRGFAGVSPDSVQSDQYHPINPPTYVNIVLENLPATIPFADNQGPESISSLRSDLALLKDWLEEGKSTSAQKELKHAMRCIETTQNDISKILDTHAEVFELHFLQDAKQAVDLGRAEDNGWRTISSTLSSIIEAVSPLIANFKSGLGDDFTKDKILQLLESEAEQEERSGKDADKLKHAYVSEDHKTLELRKMSESELLVSDCKTALVESIYDRLEKLASELQVTKERLKHVRQLMEDLMEKPREGLPLVGGLRVTTPTLKNWIRIVEKQMQTRVGAKRGFVDECSDEWVRKKNKKSWF